MTKTFTGTLAEAKAASAEFILALEAKGGYVEMIELRESGITVTWRRDDES